MKNLYVIIHEGTIDKEMEYYEGRLAALRKKEVDRSEQFAHNYTIETMERFIWDCKVIKNKISLIKRNNPHIIIPDHVDPTKIPYEAKGRSIRLGGGLAEKSVEEHLNALLENGYKPSDIAIWYPTTLYCHELPDRSL